MSESIDPQQAGPVHENYREFARLGRGGRQDTLSFRLILRLLVRCLPLIRPVRGSLIGLIICSSLALASLAWPAITAVNIFWNGAVAGDPLSPIQATAIGLSPSEYAQAEKLSPEARRTVLRHLVVSVTILGVLMAPFAIGLAYWRVWILQRINQLLRLQIVDRLQTLSLRFHSEQRVGDSMYRMFQDSSMVTQLIQVIFLQPIQYIFRFLFSLGLISLWDPRLALLLLLAWPPLILIGRFCSRGLRMGFRRAREANSALTSRVQETLEGLRVIKAYGAEKREGKKFEKASTEAFSQAYVARIRFVNFSVFVFWCLGLFLLAAVGWATYLTQQGAPLYGEAFFVAMGFASINSGVWDLGFYNNFKDRFGAGSGSARSSMGLWSIIQDVATGLDRTFELLDLEAEVEESPQATPMQGAEQAIRYHHVGFGYERDRPIFRDVNLEIKAGQIVALVGATGSGKTTLTNLLLRLYDPDTGRIEIDGSDIRDFTLHSLRKNISVSLQENILFSASVEDNIRYAMPEAERDEVRHAAAIACANDFIEDLPNGYETLLGERGARLSTGQRQRISIARALIKDSPILILDEPTASLDARTEHAVLNNLTEWGRGRFIFLITHRLSTIRKADLIAVMSEEGLCEFGSHADLMARQGGEYRRLVEAEELALDDGMRVQ
ncbi:MAG: ABC transporter ATP-binding protein [Myxococcota bacterium]|nr:ABC transporter ATP-binding protein [Myxococcota bacterium]